MSVISRLVDHSPYVGLFLLFNLGAFGFPLPEDTNLIFCGFLIASHVVAAVPAVLVAFAGLLSADLIVFFLGRKYGRMVVTNKKFQRIISPENLAQLETKFDRWGVWLIIVGRHVVGLRTQLIVTAGVVRMPLLKFVLADAVTVPVTMLVMIGIGYVGGNSLRIVRRDISRVEHIAILLAVILAVIFLVVKSVKSKSGTK